MQVKERPLMSEEEFKEYVANNAMLSYEGTRAFKSIKRAMRRGHITPAGIMYPKRPFNNRSNRFGTRPHNELKKRIYEKLRERGV